MSRTFTITLNDGTQIKNLELSGNTFMSQNEINAEIFDGNLKHVVISCDNDEEYRDKYNLTGEHENMELVLCDYYEAKGVKKYELPGQKPVYYPDEAYWRFVIRELSEQEMRDLEIDSRLDYCEMMMEE